MRGIGLGALDQVTVGAAAGGSTEMRLHPADITALADAIAARPTVLDGRRVSQPLEQQVMVGVR